VILKEIVDRLISVPRRSQIKIDFDLVKKNFYLSTPIFSSHNNLPKVIKDYVEARKSSSFKPHSTSFQVDGTKVLLIQEVSFYSKFQDNLRRTVDEFWQMSKQVNRMFCEIAVEDQYKDALHLDTHFEE